MEILVPIFVCVVLPVSIVFLSVYGKINSTNKQAEVLKKALECNNTADVDKLAETMNRRRLFSPKNERTPRELLNLRLLRGCIFTLVGLLLAGATALTGALSGEEKFAVVQLVGVLPICGIFFAIGISYLIVYFVTRKEVGKNA